MKTLKQYKIHSEDDDLRWDLYPVAKAVQAYHVETTIDEAGELYIQLSN